ncbi:hypothetical protein V2J09_018653 [Rumex salicifolius]
MTFFRLCLQRICALELLSLEWNRWVEEERSPLLYKSTTLNRNQHHNILTNSIALIKDLAAVHHAECLAYCQELLELQTKWEETRGRVQNGQINVQRRLEIPGVSPSNLGANSKVNYLCLHLCTIN